MTARTVIRKDADLLEYWRIVWKRRNIALVVLGACLILTLAASLLTKPKYEGTARILIEEQGSGRFNLQDFLGSASAGANDFMGTYFQTQLRILQSRTLAERVVRRLSLQDLPEYRVERGGRRGLFGAVSALFGRKTAGEGEAGETDPGTDPAALAAERLLEDLSVVPVPDTRLVDVSYRSPGPRLAADVVNTLAREYIDYSIESRSEATQQTSDFLNEQIAALRQDLDSKERQIQRYTEEKRILPLNEKESNAVSQYGEAAKAASDAEVVRIMAESRYRELQKLQADALPQNVSDPAIQTLRAGYLAARGEYDEKIRTTFKADHPDMIRLRTRVETLKSQLESEIKKLADAAYNEYLLTLDQEKRLKQFLEGKRVDVSRMNNDSLFFASLQTDVQTLKDLLQRLISQQKETQVSAMMSGLRTSNIKIIDRALMPEKPVVPNTRRNLVVALLLGLMIGAGAAILVHALDNTIKSPEDLEALTDIPSLGIIPCFAPNGGDDRTAYRAAYGEPEDLPAGPAPAEIELINHHFPKIAIAEDYRTIRTAILFSRVDATQNVIAFTSTQPKEGKSATISNLAVSFAQMGEEVLVIDADLRKPRLHKIFKVRNDLGLSDVLAGRAPLKEAVQRTATPKLSLLSSGPHPPNPAELLNSRKMKDMLGSLRKCYDIILVDLPPVLAVIDPVIVAALADLTILVLKTGKTTRKPLLQAIEELRKAKARVAGIVFNNAESRSRGSYAPYFQYEYYQDKGLDDEKPVKTEGRKD